MKTSSRSSGARVAGQMSLLACFLARHKIQLFKPIREDIRSRSSLKYRNKKIKARMSLKVKSRNHLIVTSTRYFGQN